jgi:hypothetical protein
MPVKLVYKEIYPDGTYGLKNSLKSQSQYPVITDGWLGSFSLLSMTGRKAICNQKSTNRFGRIKFLTLVHGIGITPAVAP